MVSMWVVRVSVWVVRVNMWVGRLVRGSFGG